LLSKGFHENKSQFLGLSYLIFYTPDFTHTLMLMNTIRPGHTFKYMMPVIADNSIYALPVLRRLVRFYKSFVIHDIEGIRV